MEEKANRYDKFVEELKSKFKDFQVIIYNKNDLEKFFPELKNEDERMRNVAINACKYMVDNFENSTKQYEEAIAWLEKQGEQKPVDKYEPMSLDEAIKHCKEKSCGNNACALEHKQLEKWLTELKELKEQKPADKVVPKFHEGEWLVNNKYGNVVRVLKVLEDNYRLDFNGDTSGTLCTELVDNDYHLWTIQYAKDGDVLVDGNLPFIFKNIDSMMRSYAYCGISVDSGFKIESEGELGEWTWMQDIKPATKEQRDQLKKAMADAGYTFDFDKKELKKIEQKPAWGEENDGVLLESISVLQNNSHWVLADKLKSLKDRYIWKPSDEQMNGLNEAIKFLGCTKTRREQLQSLYEQLKKLREE